MMRLLQILIGLDQLLNACLAGYADETLSARAYRRRRARPRWMLAYRTINAVFFWQHDHCRAAYLSEVERRQLPPEYRVG